MFPSVIVKQISWQQHLKCAKRPLVLHHLLQGLPRTTQELSSDGECPWLVCSFPSGGFWLDFLLGFIQLTSRFFARFTF